MVDRWIDTGLWEKAVFFVFLNFCVFVSLPFGVFFSFGTIFLLLLYGADRPFAALTAAAARLYLSCVCFIRGRKWFLVGGEGGGLGQLKWNCICLLARFFSGISA